MKIRKEFWVIVRCRRFFIPPQGLRLGLIGRCTWLLQLVSRLLFRLFARCTRGWLLSFTQFSKRSSIFRLKPLFIPQRFYLLSSRLQRSFTLRQFFRLIRFFTPTQSSISQLRLFSLQSSRPKLQRFFPIQPQRFSRLPFI